MHETITETTGLIESGIVALQLGGPVVVILLAMSVFALAITLLKIYQFRTVRIGDTRAVREALVFHRAGHNAAAVRALAGARNPMADILALAIRGRMRDDLDESIVREEVARLSGNILEKLRIYLRPLELIASLAPLLGLLGTVLGMIEAFQRLEESGSRVDPAILSGGIWEALLTTAVGLAVAIPAVAVLSWFERIIDRFGHEMESAVTRVFTSDLADGVDELDGREPARLRMAALGSGE